MFAAPTRQIGLAALATVLLLSTACVEEELREQEQGLTEQSGFDSGSIHEFDHADLEEMGEENYTDPAAPVMLLDIPHNQAARALFEDGIAHIESSDPFQQISAMVDAGDLSDFSFQYLQSNGEWSSWAPVEITFEEGIMKNILIRLDEPTQELKLRDGEELYSAQLEFYDAVLARGEFLPNPEAPVLTPEELRASMTASVAPGNLVIPRRNWGATNPDKVCGNVVRPYRIAIHHTYRPANDGGNAAARMRSMQSYHMNNLGWCDIGYHFVISQSGHIYQGRSRSDRPGAHVGGQNSGNIGISFIADFTSQTPTNTQLDAGARIMRWAKDQHGFNLTRSTVRGHREHAGQSTSCPGGMVNHLQNLIDRANGSTGSSSAPAAPAPSSPSTAPAPTNSPGSGSGGQAPSNPPNYSAVQSNGCSSTGSSTHGGLAALLLLGFLGLRRRKA